jgi:hypothetical protein
MKTHFFTGLLLLIFSQIVPADSNFFNFCDNKSKETLVTGAVAERITATIKKLPEEGSHIQNIELIAGIRTMDSEIASPGEIKILVSLDWQALPNHPERRTALDNAAAHIVAAVFTEHNDMTKIRVLVKIPKDHGKYQTAAKVFSFTRATWELAKNDARYRLDTPTGASNLLALGDYVILTDQGWTRGY